MKVVANVETVLITVIPMDLRCVERSDACFGARRTEVNRSSGSADASKRSKGPHRAEVSITKRLLSNRSR